MNPVQLAAQAYSEARGWVANLLKSHDGALDVYQASRSAGERQEDSTTGADHKAVAGEWAVKAIAYNGDAAARTIYDGPCLVAGIEVTTAMSAHASGLQDNGVERYPIPASRAAGIYTFPGPIIFKTDAVWAPGSLSAGAIIVWYRPFDPIVTWAY